MTHRWTGKVSMTKVLNAHIVGQQPTEGRVYIGRPSKWGNPFVIGRDGDREQVVAKYRAWLAEQPDLLLQLHELIGKDLVCWCAPKPCHGHVLQSYVLRVSRVLETADRRDEHD
jgi:hypothetical protein